MSEDDIWDFKAGNQESRNVFFIRFLWLNRLTYNLIFKSVWYFPKFVFFQNILDIKLWFTRKHHHDAFSLKYVLFVWWCSTRCRDRTYLRGVSENTRRSGYCAARHPRRRLVTCIDWTTNLPSTHRRSSDRVRHRCPDRASRRAVRWMVVQGREEGTDNHLKQIIIMTLQF